MRPAHLLAAGLFLNGCGATVHAPRAAKAYADAGLASLVLEADYAGAARDLTRAIKLDPKNSRLYVLRGMAYLKEGAKDAAAADFKTAGSLDGRLKKALAPLKP